MEKKAVNWKALIGFIIWLVLVFLWFIFVNEYTLNTWEKVLLKTRPVDPRDLLRWDYVILSYELEEDNKVSEFLDANEGEEDYYFILKTDEENYAYLEEVSSQKPKEWLFIKVKRDKSLGINKYFIPEGRGREIENLRWELDVLVSIDKYGTAKIVDLYYKWEKIDFSEEITK